MDEKESVYFYQLAAIDGLNDFSDPILKPLLIIQLTTRVVSALPLDIIEIMSISVYCYLSFTAHILGQIIEEIKFDPLDLFFLTPQSEFILSKDCSGARYHHGISNNEKVD